MVKQLIKIGSSCGLVLPAEALEQLQLKPGDKVDLLSDGVSLRIVPLTRVKPISLGGLWAGTEITEEDMAAVRKETWRDPFR